ncbi:Cytochrome c oxidase subunit 2 [Candidatus Thermoflexus japonica]|uniref:Cytochrome c oxidase subunit 2 n=1 Tax=Candidatus Thermoflexus japonica TaxID=2035417 RepID=A0A2H5Y350_9CHLR|nr:Cytochrome c oxidase subunit 2 [Candidatus Thermoflexus japonica]
MRGAWFLVSGIGLLGFIAPVVGLVFRLTPGRTPVVREVELLSQAFHYDPLQPGEAHTRHALGGRIEVRWGERVVLHLRAVDTAHGFYLDGYGINRVVQPGEEVTIEFIAIRPGKFRFRCSETCGPLHPFMIGELVVTPNLPFYSSALGTIFLALAVVGRFWWLKGEA